MGNKLPGITRDTLDAWKALVEITRNVYPQAHPAQALTLSHEDMLAIVNERIAGTFTTTNLHRRIAIMKAAFPSSPTKPPLLGFFFKHENDRLQHHSFAALYSAKKFLDTLLSSCEFKWVSDFEIEVLAPHYFTITCDGPKDGLDQVFEYKPTQEEKDWELPSPYPSYIRQILRSKSNPAIDADTPLTEPEQEKVTQVAPKPAKRAQPLPLKQKPVSEGMISLQDVAQSCDIDAKQARTILRSSNTPKPASGRWEFTPGQAAQIKAILIKGKK